jgi:hypothetical protein
MIFVRNGESKEKKMRFEERNRLEKRYLTENGFEMMKSYMEYTIKQIRTILEKDIQEMIWKDFEELEDHSNDLKKMTEDLETYSIDYDKYNSEILKGAY